MIQILEIKSNKKKIILFSTQLVLSILLVLILIYYISYHFYKISQKEQLSKTIVENYKLSKLYNHKNIENSILGIINIPSLNIEYPIFSDFTEELLSISPCRLYGPKLGKKGNICIAAHNYDNNKFFSNIGNLKPNTMIYISSGNFQYSYNVISNYEVDEKDLSPIFNYDENQKNLTLITCNNINGNRTIVRAIQKE